ncbi:MAG: hypothetical protein AB8G77_26285 [Rhodothermales bacterium]
MRISSEAFINRIRHLCEGRDPVFWGIIAGFAGLLHQSLRSCPVFAGMTAKGVDRYTNNESRIKYGKTLQRAFL